MESIDNLMENSKTIVLMKYLSRPTSRRIIRLILESPRDLYEICKLTKKKKSTVFEILKGLEENNIIKSHLIKVGKYGRKKKQYYIDDIQIPRMTKETMLDFLEGKEIGFREELIEFVEIMQSLENVNVSFSEDIKSKLSPEILLVDMLNADFTLKEILPVFLDLRDKIGFDTNYDDIRTKILEILREKQFLEEKIRNYSDITKKNLMIRFSSDQLESREMNDLISIAESELNVNTYEAIFIVENSIRILKSLDINFVEYPHLVMFLYFFAQGRSIPCKKPDFLQIFVPEECQLFIARSEGETRKLAKFTLPPIFERSFSDSVQIRILDSKNGIWTRKDIANYLLSNFRLEYDRAELLSYEILDKIKYLNLFQYSQDFLDTLIKELSREHGF